MLAENCSQAWRLLRSPTGSSSRSWSPASDSSRSPSEPRGWSHPSRPLPEKLTTYECGIDPVGEGWSQSQIRYYIYGFLFVIFDVEAVFLFPWAGIFEGLGYQAVVEMAIFIGILAVGLLYAWRKGVLRWA